MFWFSVFVKSVAPENTLGTLKWLWLIMLIPEIVAIAFAGRIRRRIGVRVLMFAGLAAGGLKWLACGFLGDVPFVLHASMLLHCVYLVGALVPMPLCPNSILPAALRSTGHGSATMCGCPRTGRRAWKTHQGRGIAAPAAKRKAWWRGITHQQRGTSTIRPTAHMTTGLLP